jgi:adenylate cyclase
LSASPEEAILSAPPVQTGRYDVTSSFPSKPDIAAKPKRAFSAVRMIPLAVGILVAASLLPVMMLGYLGANDNTGRLLTQNRDIMLDGLEQKIRDSLDGTSSQMTVVAGMIADGRVDPSDRVAFSSFMAGVAQGQTSMVSTAWLEREGPLRRWLRDGRGEETHPREAIARVDELWEEADRLRRPFWRGAAMSRIVGAAIIPHVEPVVRDGTLIGLIITVATAESISRFISAPQDGVTPFVLVGRDRVLAHPNVGGSNMIADGLPGLDDVGDEALAMIWKDPRPPAQNVPGRSQIHWTWLGDSFRAQVYTYRTIEGYGGTPWLIGFHRSSLDSFRERWVVQGLFWGSGLLLVLAVLAAYLAGKRVIQPAGEIAEAARALERLDFDGVDRPAIAGSRVAEIRDTSHALSRAAAVLRRFQTYVPRALVGQLMAMDTDASAASDREVSILFIDLSGYTAFSEGRPARDVAAYLNGIFAEIGPLIEAAGGTIDKYTGDGLMAVWGAPVSSPDHVRDAWTASLRILERMTPLMAQALARDPSSCRMRIGLHTGRVLAGDLGFKGRIDYTVVGRTVNVAQRAQGALRSRMGDAPVGLAITETFRKALDIPREGLAPLPAEKGGEPAYRVLWLTPEATRFIADKREAAE